MRALLVVALAACGDGAPSSWVDTDGAQWSITWTCVDASCPSVRMTNATAMEAAVGALNRVTLTTQEWVVQGDIDELDPKALDLDGACTSCPDGQCPTGFELELVAGGEVRMRVSASGTSAIGTCGTQGQPLEPLWSLHGVPE